MKEADPTLIRYSYEYVPTIKAFSQCDDFIRGLMGPFGSGKSSGCVVEIIKRAHEQRPGPDGIRRTRWAIVRNSYIQLRDTTIKTFCDWIPPDHFGTFFRSTHDYIITGFDGVEIEILFRALDRPEQIANLLSLELTGAWVNEAREVPWPIIDALTGRLMRYPSKREGGPTWSGLILDTNPPDDLSSWYRFFEERRPEGASLFKQPSARGPDAENLPNLPDPSYYENLMRGKDEEWLRVYVDGQYGFVTDGKPVYPEYNDTLHCVECGPVKKKPIRRSWDFGLTPACTFSQIQPGGRWVVFDELTAESMGIDRFSDDVLAHCEEAYSGFDFEDYGDPAGAQRAQTDEKTCFQILSGKGINATPGEQAESMRLESVKKPLRTLLDGKPQFMLDPRCKMLRRGFMGGYQFRRMQTAAERYQEKPEKNQYSHPHDALQYDASRLFAGELRGRENRKREPIRYDDRGII